MLVLRARGVESEAEIPFAGLHALLRPAFDRLDTLPGPQAGGAARRARPGARRRERPLPDRRGDAEPARRARRAAPAAGRRRRRALGGRVLARRDPVRRAAPVRGHGGVPDRHARRGRPTCQRSRSKGSTARRPPPCSSTTPGSRCRPAPPTASSRPRSATRWRSSSWPRRPPSCRPTARLRVETSVEHAFAPRIAALPEPARRLLALAAAEDSGELAVLERAASALGLDLAALAAGRARRARDRRPSDQLAFCHPLARSAAYRSAPSDERRAAHAALAAADPDADRRAWHRAAAALGPDDEAAARSRARRRRAPAPAARTPPPPARSSAPRGSPPRRPERARRLFAAAEAAWLAGHTERATQRLAEAREACDDPALRLEIDHLRGHAALRSGRVIDAHDILVAAAEHAPAATGGGDARRGLRGLLLRRAAGA